MRKPTIAIIQARMGSTRLPGKVLMPILGRPVLWHIVQRLKRVEAIDQILVATSQESRDEDIARYCEEEQISCFRGSERDVLDRFYRAARHHQAGQVIRITGDCPLVDPPLIGRLIRQHLAQGCDYSGVATGAGVANDPHGGRFPDGLDAEIFSFEALAEAWCDARQPLHREHVTPFFWQQPDRFRLGVIRGETDYGKLRWTLDYPEDYRLISWIFEQLYPGNPHFHMLDVLELLKANQDKLTVNQGRVGQDNYQEFWNDTE